MRVDEGMSRTRVSGPQAGTRGQPPSCPGSVDLSQAPGTSGGGLVTGRLKPAVRAGLARAARGDQLAVQGPLAQAWNPRRPQRHRVSLGPHKLPFVPQAGQDPAAWAFSLPRAPALSWRVNGPASLGPCPGLASGLNGDVIFYTNP